MIESIDSSLLPIYEWEIPQFAILGGLSLNKIKYDYQAQYLKYLETLAKVIPIKYFANKDWVLHQR
jgi:hypothetical protein